MNLYDVVVWIAERIGFEIEGRMSKAAKLLEQKIKDVLNVQAPKKKVVSRLGEIYFRATTPAQPGAPPRRVTGLGRAGLTVKAENRTSIVIFNAAKSKTGFPYMDHHEGINKTGLHPYIIETFRKNKPSLERVSGLKLRDLRTVEGTSRPERRSTGEEVAN